jgi:hypothetical protein
MSTPVSSSSVPECNRCGTGKSRGRRRRCDRCRVAARLETVAPAVLTNPELQPLVEYLSTSTGSNLDDVVRWLRGGIAIVLQALATGELALTHEALDTCARHQAAEYLRYRLMACGLLPVHGRHLRAYQSWLRRPCVGASPAADVHARSDEECDRCGTTAPGRHGRSPRCSRCRIVTRLEKVAPAVLTSPELRPLLEHLAVDPRPNRIQVWLGGGVVDLLQALGSGEVALTHEALHAWHSPQAVPHLRHQLIACGLLPAIDPHLAYFETWLHHRLAALADHPHHQLLRRFALWHQLPRLRADAAARPLRATARQYAMGQFFAGTALLTWLDEHRIEPRHLTQAPLDQWCLTIPLYSRHRIRGFLLWATQHGHVPPGLDLPNLTFQPGTAMTQQQRIELLRRYVNDETHDDTDDGAAPLHARTAACFLLLYAQPLSRILRLTHDDVVDTAFFLRGDELRAGHGSHLDRVALPIPHRRRRVSRSPISCMCSLACRWAMV